jgi:hypothetical protein
MTKSDSDQFTTGRNVVRAPAVPKSGCATTPVSAIDGV